MVRQEFLTIDLSETHLYRLSLPGSACDDTSLVPANIWRAGRLPYLPQRTLIYHIRLIHFIHGVRILITIHIISLLIFVSDIAFAHTWMQHRTICRDTTYRMLDY